MKDVLKAVILSKEDLIGIPDGFYVRYNEGDFRKNINEITDLLISKGFKEIETPIFDMFELYQRTIGEEKTRELFVYKTESNDFLVPRYDITSQIVRFFRTRIDKLEKPIKVFYYGDVFRNPYVLWREKQFKQLGVEVIGLGSEVEKYLFSVLSEVLRILKRNMFIGEFVLVVNYVNIIEYFLSKFDEVERKIIRKLISSKDIGTLRKILPKEATTLEKIFLPIDKRDLGKVLKDIGIDDETISKATSCIEDLNIEEEVIVDISLLPPFDYYDGIYFNVYASNVNGSLISGGRYDKLTHKFGYSETAIGFSINF